MPKCSIQNLRSQFRQVQRGLLAASVTLAMCLAWGSTGSAQSLSISEDWKTTEDRQFDFWIGKWDAVLRIKQKDKTWRDSIKADVEIFPVLDGKAILELWNSGPIKGFSLRHFDHDQNKWVLYLNWPSNAQSSSIGSLSGQFRHGRGEFFSDNGTTLSRYTFCDITPTSLRWDDAFSKDGGATWTNNWIMEFSRTAEKAQWPEGFNAHTSMPGGRCQGEPFDLINRMVGQWEGEIQFDEGGTKKAKLKVYRVLGGCSVTRFLEYQESESKIVRQFGILTWNARLQKFEELVLDNQKNTNAQIFRGRLDDSKLRGICDKEFDGEPLATQSGLVWTLPENEDGKLRMEISSSSDGMSWQRIGGGTFKRIVVENPKEEKEGAEPINRFCPRSGKPVSLEFSTTYRGRVVAFCNAHCRDEFAGDPEKYPTDRKFFDQIIDKNK